MNIRAAVPSSVDVPHLRALTLLHGLELEGTLDADSVHALQVIIASLRYLQSQYPTAFLAEIEPTKVVWDWVENKKGK